MTTDAAALARRIRVTVIEQSKRANIGHIGSSLSIADILAALYSGPLAGADPADPERDRFVLSKGHAALALYAALAATGRISGDDLERFATDGTSLGGHPEHAQHGIDFSTGSLGHGLSVAAGSALAARKQGSARRAIALVSDAECNEGSLWEAVMFAAHHGLSNLIAIVDRNGQQALGKTADVLDLDPIAERFRAFGWDATEVDGHDPAAVAEAVAGLDTETGPPHVLVAATTFGRGVSYMEDQLHWHYWPMDDDQYRDALEQVSA